MFQSLGLNNPRFNKLRRRFAQGFAASSLVGNVSFPIVVQLHAVDAASVPAHEAAHGARVPRRTR